MRRDSIVALDAGAHVFKRAPLAARSLKLVPERVVQGAVKMRGQNESPLMLVGPRGAVMAREGLTLEWRGPAGTYRVELIDDDGRVVAAAELDRFSWLLPPAIRLVEGASYLWRVIALDAPGTRREARAEFSLLFAAERRQWMATRPSGQASVAERTRYALALEQRGLNAAAAAQWRELALERPALAQRRDPSAAP
ncbi:MAG: hypothetical protein RRY41_04505 [Burkholderiaceae bacterium]